MIEVHKFSTWGEFICTYKSFITATNDNNMPEGRISTCINTDGTTSGGFIWSLEHTLPDEEALNRPVWQWDMDGEFKQKFDTLKDCAKHMDEVYTKILDACNGKMKNYKRHVYSFFPECPIRFVPEGIPVYKFDKDTGVLLKRYSDITEASVLCDIPSSDIRKVLSNKRFSTNGFYWGMEPEYTVIEPENKKIECHQFDFDGNYIQSHPSLHRAGLATGMCYTLIHDACKPHTSARKAGNFMWSFTKECEPLKAIGKGVTQMKLNGEEVQRFENQLTASRISGVDQSAISACCINTARTAGNFKWKFTEEEKEVA